MKVLAISGSPRPQGNTRLLLETALRALEGHGIATEYLSLHDKDIRPCLACMKCAQDKNRCAQEDDFMPVYEAMAAADGLIVGSPVYFGSATPNLMALLDRAGYVARQGDNPFYRKVGSPVVVARRATTMGVPTLRAKTLSPWRVMKPARSRSAMRLGVAEPK